MTDSLAPFHHGPILEGLKQGPHHLSVLREGPGDMQENSGVDGDFAPLTAQELLTQDADELRRRVADKREEAERAREAEARGADGDVSAAAMEMDGAGPQDIPASKVSSLEGHTSEVFICAWSPDSEMLASG